ncbi:MAG: vWA domain-containing protein [Hyphomicrobiaceae bacterium]
MTWFAAKDWRFWSLAVAAVAILGALFMPRIETERDVSDILFVIDITGSMNTRDVEANGATASRLELVRSTILETIQRIDCRSKVGLGLFTERRSFLLFEPVEICGNYAPISGALQEIDWRMAWEGDSYIAKGLYSALDIADSGGWNLVFFTDGHEAPPLAHGEIPDFEGKPGAVAGLIVGVGGTEKVPIPKFDLDGRETGTWRATEVTQENRVGVPPKDASLRAGWHPRNAPWGASSSTGEEHLTSRRDEHLEVLAGKTSLHYLKLGQGPSLVATMGKALSSRRILVASDVSQYPAWFALVVLAALFAGAPLAALGTRMNSRTNALHSRKGIASL